MTLLSKTNFLSIIIIFVLLLSTPIINAQSCETPTSGCINGLWSKISCRCECISPFCHDQYGECTVPSNNLCVGTTSKNPWRDCTPGQNCPWYVDFTRLEDCTEGNVIPPGIWDIYSSKEVCCNVNHPYSTTCSVPPEVPTVEEETTTTNNDDEFEVILIKFSLSGLPDIVNMRALKLEMTMVLKRILVDISGRFPSSNIRVTNVEENLLITMDSINELNVGEYTDGSRQDVYYDITVVRREDGSSMGPIIIAGIKDSYDVLVDDITSYTNLEYFGAGVDFNVCANDEDTKENSDNDANHGNSFAMCSNNDEKVRVKFRLSNIPQEDTGTTLDNVDSLIQHIIIVYKQLLEGSIAKLEIIDIEVSQTIDLVSSPASPDDEDEERTITKDVFLDIIVKRKFDVPDFTPAVNEKLSSSRDVILNEIQSYTDALSIGQLKDVNWCINDENAYAICTQSSSSKFLLPNWAIITITVISVILACCLCWGVHTCIQQRDAHKNERNMATYIDSGALYSKQRRVTWDDNPPPPQQQRRMRVDYDRPRSIPRSQQPHPRPRRPGDRRTYEEGESIQPQKHLMLQNDTTYYENMPSFVFDDGEGGHSPQQQLATTNDKEEHWKENYRSETEYYLEAMPSFVFDKGDEEGPSPPQLAITKEVRKETKKKKENYRTETEYLEALPSFVFDKGEDGGPRQLVISKADQSCVSSKLPDPDGEHHSVIGGKWFVDEESAAPPKHRHEP